MAAGIEFATLVRMREQAAGAGARGCADLGRIAAVVVALLGAVRALGLGCLVGLESRDAWRGGAH
jgi:hypothetical protein